MNYTIVNKTNELRYFNGKLQQKCIVYALDNSAKHTAPSAAYTKWMDIEIIWEKMPILEDPLNSNTKYKNEPTPIFHAYSSTSEEYIRKGVLLLIEKHLAVPGLSNIEEQLLKELRKEVNAL